MKKLLIPFVLAAAAAVPCGAQADDYTESQPVSWSPAGGFCGDPMPFFDEKSGEFKVLYLQDYRPNGETYHAIHGVSSREDMDYTYLGELIQTGNRDDLDAAIGTGSTIFHDNLYYTFYTGHRPGKEVVLAATSPDFKTWTKMPGFSISGAGTYDQADFRDPCVYKGEDGRFHMLVSTRKEGKGVFAEYVSDNLRDWTDNGVFMTMLWDRFWECPDLFKWNDWWYLVYSDTNDGQRNVHYFKGKTLDELRNCTRDEGNIGWPDNFEGRIEGRGFFAGKTASDGIDRYIWGWCGTRPNNYSDKAYEWAGHLVSHKLRQHPENGSLLCCENPATANRFGPATYYPDIELGGWQELTFPALGTTNRITAAITTKDNFGFTIARSEGSDDYYALNIVNEPDNKRKINFEHIVNGESFFVPYMDSQMFPAYDDGIYNVTIVTDHSVVTVYIDDEVAFTARIHDTMHHIWSLRSMGDDARLTAREISVSTALEDTRTVQELFAGAYNIGRPTTWGNTFRFGEENFANPEIKPGCYLSITLKEPEFSEDLRAPYGRFERNCLEIKGNGTWIPGSHFHSVNKTVEYRAYMTVDMLEALRNHGLEICGDKFVVTSVRVKNNGYVMPEYAIWGGFKWIDGWKELEIFRTAFDKYDGQQQLDIHLSEENSKAGHTGYDMEVFTRWNDASAVWSKDEVTSKYPDKTNIKLNGIDVKGTLEGSDRLIIHTNPGMEGHKYNLTAVVLRPNDIVNSLESVTDGTDAGIFPAEVYNLQGIRVATMESPADRPELPAGVYIVNGRKTVIR